MSGEEDWENFEADENLIKKEGEHGDEVIKQAQPAQTKKPDQPSTDQDKNK